MYCSCDNAETKNPVNKQTQLLEEFENLIDQFYKL